MRHIQLHEPTQITPVRELTLLGNGGIILMRNLHKGRYAQRHNGRYFMTDENAVPEMGLPRWGDRAEIRELKDRFLNNLSDVRALGDFAERGALALAQVVVTTGLNPYVGEIWALPKKQKGGAIVGFTIMVGIKGLRRAARQQAEEMGLVYPYFRPTWRMLDEDEIALAGLCEGDRGLACELELFLPADHVYYARYEHQPYTLTGVGILRAASHSRMEPIQAMRKRAEADALKQGFDLPFGVEDNGDQVAPEDERDTALVKGPDVSMNEYLAQLQRGREKYDEGPPAPWGDLGMPLTRGKAFDRPATPQALGDGLQALVVAEEHKGDKAANTPVTSEQFDMLRLGGRLVFGDKHTDSNLALDMILTHLWGVNLHGMSYYRACVTIWDWLWQFDKPWEVQYGIDDQRLPPMQEGALEEARLVLSLHIARATGQAQGAIKET